MEAQGVGTDFLSNHTRLNAKAKVAQLHYGKYHINNLLAVAHVANGKVHADIDSNNQLLKGLVSLDALTNSKNLEATVVADVRNADLYLMGLTKVPMRATACGQVDLKTNLKEDHYLQAMLGSIVIKTQQKEYRPVDIVADVLTRRDTTHAVLNCGDFHLRMDTHGGYKSCCQDLMNCKAR